MIWGCLNFCRMFSSIETSIAAAYTWWVLKVILYERWLFFWSCISFGIWFLWFVLASITVLSCFCVVPWHNHPTFREVSDVWFELSTFARVGLIIILAQPVLNFTQASQHVPQPVHCGFKNSTPLSSRSILIENFR